ncbi:aminobenzoyl-glutamate utilization protein A [Halorubrum aquaticum]|uniref:Aminobenzoyl-glutamate utilization protein A n=1 Tax=Halorubrum aquaticum TaxID=387340 RepID=A0A1I2ZJF2_9EURY|nr:amidohydrolase [Halorubrum aquaticum]SFH37850.1 aminobenzoyl-glutamate utilization protein A [Halorubrum aquaticum]
MNAQSQSRLIELRRDLHRRPEIGWREFYTTDRIVEELEAIGPDELYVGSEVHREERIRPPTDDQLARARERARETGVDEDVLSKVEDGYTGALAVLRKGEGPTVLVRVDIDGLPQSESEDPDHVPAAEGFRSTYDDRMHACGHDAHAAIGVGVLEAVKESDFEGTLKVLFQPAEELGAGAASVVGSGHLDDVDSLIAVHVGLDVETGVVVPGIESFLAINGFEATFEGSPAHAGNSPQEGAHAIQALSTAVGNLHAIPRHGDGATRVNVGVVEGGTATNIVPESASLEGEVRGTTTELRNYVEDHALRVLRSAAELHDCEVDVSFRNGAPSSECDDSLVDAVSAAAAGHDATVTPDEGDALGGSEDATRLMRAVQRNGGDATYVGFGASNPTGHHTATFDVDEAVIPLAVDTLTDAIRSISAAE